MSEFIQIAKWSKDLAGQRFNRLVAIGPVKRTNSGNIVWRCRCDCGSFADVAAGSLRSNWIKSCGCLLRESYGKASFRHGKSSSPEYRAHTGMVMRCTVKSNRQFQDYGGRGIIVCDRWLRGESGKTGFECFYADMGPRPSPLHSIDRENNDGNYEPGNCRWATLTVQANNKRSNIVLVYNGQTRTARQWERLFGWPKDTIRSRIHSGWTIERALAEAPDDARSTRARKAHPKGQKSERLIEYMGETMSVAAWARRLGIKEMTLHSRLKRMTVAVAFTRPIGRWA